MHDTPQPAPHSPTQDALALLACGVPLSLLLDLAMPLDSVEVYGAEPADTRWVPTAVA
ncbi:MAG TPA: hypothetical protein VM433_13000 [Mycobacteriales bacterium]|nr:hypothetical protein [Mycobacteriales bacterium]